MLDPSLERVTPAISACFLEREFMMAEKTIERVDEQLNCTVCLDTYTDPKILQCFHVYCKKCLVKLIIRDPQGKLSLSCPICRQVTPVPPRGAAGLQSAFLVNPLLEILDQHKKAQASAQMVDSKNESSFSRKSSTIYCSEHDQREVELFCETCEELICYKCAIKDGKHHSHNYKDIEESFENYREEVMPSLKLMEKQMMTTVRVLTELDRRCDDIADQQASITSEIMDSSNRLHEIINVRQGQLIGQLDQITRKKLKSLATQRDQIETVQAQLSSCLEFMRKSFETCTQQREVLVMKTDTLKQARELTSVPQMDIFTLSTKADMAFSGSSSTIAACKEYGKVYTLNYPDPTKCYATGKGAGEAVVGEQASCFLTALSFKGRPCDPTTVSMSFRVELVSEITCSKVTASVECSSKRGEYVICYQPKVKGRHQLHIKAGDQHISGSPFSVTVKLPVEKIGTAIQTWSGLDKCWEIAVSEKDEVAVTEYRADRVSVLSPCGEKLRSFGKRGNGQGQFKKPCGVAMDGWGNILVADSGNHRIQKFTSNGSFLKAVGSMGSGVLQFYNPYGIAYNASNNKVYVTDLGNDRVQVLNSDLTYFYQFGGKGSGRGQFKSVSSVATDSNGESVCG